MTKSVKVIIPYINKMPFSSLYLEKSLIKTAHNGFIIRSMNPIPELMPCIFPDTLSKAPLGSAGKSPASRQPIPNAPIPKLAAKSAREYEINRIH